MSLQPQNYEEALLKARSKPSKPRSAIKRSAPLRKTSPASTSRKRASKRSKVTTRKKLIKTIDGLVFQIMLVMYERCVECGSVEKPTTGHVLSRRSYATRWDLRNVFRQCWPCNYKAAMTAAASYHLWFVKKFGVDAFDELYRDWAKGHKYTRLELQNLVPEFEAQLETLRKDT